LTKKVLQPQWVQALFNKLGFQTQVLGCTHFPYLKEELEKVCSLPVIDPADMMYEALKGQIMDM